MRRDTIIEFNLESINLIYVDEIQYAYNNAEVSHKLWSKWKRKRTRETEEKR